MRPAPVPAKHGVKSRFLEASLGGTVLVTGGAGYIGSHMTYALLDRGEKVVVLDNLSTGLRQLVSREAELVTGDVGDHELVGRLLSEKQVDAVVHLAGSVIVPESVRDPVRYYQNNTAASLNLIACCQQQGVRNFLFSSTAAVYGAPDEAIVTEATAERPINPYGRSKLTTEWVLRDTSLACDLRYIALRYFNVAGAEIRGRTGQSTPNATHLIKRVCQVALGRAAQLEVYGADFGTPDGTGVRDYIHVSDLIDVHLLALDALRAGTESATFNCGYGHGLSVLEVVQAAERIIGKELNYRLAPRRPGDPPMLVADASKVRQALGWHPRHDDIDVILRSALDWERKAAT